MPTLYKNQFWQQLKTFNKSVQDRYLEYGHSKKCQATANRNINIRRQVKSRTILDNICQGLKKDYFVDQKLSLMRGVYQDPRR